MRWRLSSAAFAAALAGGLACAGLGAQAQSLVDEVDGLVATHPQLKAARQNVAAAEEGTNRAFSEYLPTVSAFGDFGYERIDSPSRRSTTPNQGPFTAGTARQTSVTVTQTLFNGFRNEANNAAAQLSKDAAETELEGNIQSIVFEGVTAYLEVLRNRRLIGLASEQELTIKRQLELEDERVRRGSGITVDVLQSKSRLQVAKERRVAFEGAFEDAASRYEQVFGHAAMVDEMTMPMPPLAMLPETLDDAIEAGLGEHPSIEGARTRIDIAEQQRRVARSEYFPTVDLVGEWSYEDDFDGIRGTRRDYKAKVQATWDLFDGFATRASVAESSHLYMSSIDASNFVRRKIAEEVRLAWYDLDTARERVSLLENAVNIAAEVFNARRKLREAGKETVINVLDAQSEQFNAQINLVAAQHDARLAVYRLLLAMGRLTQEAIANPDAAAARSSRAEPAAADNQPKPVQAPPEPEPKLAMKEIALYPVDKDTGPVPLPAPARPFEEGNPTPRPLSSVTGLTQFLAMDDAPGAVRTTRLPDAREQNFQRLWPYE